ncbi:hypothetical protein J3R73_002425 [Labrys monachus]|uniref:Uncharacterized protein n=1 Tax=Labrys monachus TaxID=217067 RepID=A0ABU0FDF2_9HYPH|nr:hypothetical protein [Labrys monachus]
MMSTRPLQLWTCPPGHLWRRPEMSRRRVSTSLSLSLSRPADGALPGCPASVLGRAISRLLP